MESDKAIVRYKMKLKIQELARQYPFRMETSHAPEQRQLSAYA